MVEWITALIVKWISHLSSKEIVEVRILVRAFFEKPKNGQSQKIRMASEFTKCSVGSGQVSA